MLDVEGVMKCYYLFYLYNFGGGVYCGCERSHYTVWPPGVADGKRISNTKDLVGGVDKYN